MREVVFAGRRDYAVQRGVLENPDFSHVASIENNIRFSDDRKRFDALVEMWPAAIRTRAKKLAGESFEPAKQKERSVTRRSK